VAGLSEASESAYAAVFRARAGDGSPAARLYVKEPDLLRPLVMAGTWDGEARGALEAAALSMGWKLRCPDGLGKGRVFLGPGTAGMSGTALTSGAAGTAGTGGASGAAATSGATGSPGSAGHAGPASAGKVLDLLLEIHARLLESGEALRVDVFTKTLSVERNGE
jgi:hypothetical protein